MPTFNAKMILIPGTALILALAGCTAPITTPPSVSPVVTAAPHVTLSVPPTVDAAGPLDLVIDSSGHDGEQVKLYGFPARYDQLPICTDTTVTPTSVVLTGGPQTVTLNPIQTGQDMYWILTGSGFTNQCGDAKTRVLEDPAILASRLTSDGLFQLGGDEVLQGPDVGPYVVFSTIPADPVVKVTVTVTWVGPFATAPEVNASPCPATPVAATDQFSLDSSTSKTYLSSLKYAVSSALPVPVTSPGVYRVMVEAPETAYTFAQVPVCETAMLVTIQ